MNEIITIPSFIKKKFNKSHIEIKQLSIGQTGEVRIKKNMIVTKKNNENIIPILIEITDWDYTQYDKCQQWYIYINLKLKRLN